jgi:hypothetical protein
MPITYRCPSCNGVHAANDDLGGSRQACPTCGQRLLLPSANSLRSTPPASASNPTAPIRVQVSARFLLWPQKCACCLGEVETVFQLLAPRLAAKKGDTQPERCWEVPYCRRCLTHTQGHNLESMTEDCCTTGPAVTHQGWRGTVHTFHFSNPGYARRFIEANREKCLGLAR